MVYVINLFNIADGKENVYKEYVRKSVEITSDLDMERVASGNKLLKSMTGKPRSHFIVMKFGSINDFDQMVARQNKIGLDKMREESTEDYIWTVYENWDLTAQVEK